MTGPNIGAKCIGEGGAVGPPAAIMSAGNDALRGLGVELSDLPLSPQRIRDVIKAARGPSGRLWVSIWLAPRCLE